VATIALILLGLFFGFRVAKHIDKEFVKTKTIDAEEFCKQDPIEEFYKYVASQKDVSEPSIKVQQIPTPRHRTNVVDIRDHYYHNDRPLPRSRRSGQKVLPDCTGRTMR